jgi:hypothetical protein
MEDLNTKRSRAGVLYASIVFVVVGLIGFAPAYRLQDNLKAPGDLVGDPSKRLRKGDGNPANPVILDKIDTPSAPKSA